VKANPTRRIIMTLAQMKKVLQGLPPVFRKLQASLELMRSSLASVVGQNSYSITTAFTDGTDGTGTVQFVFTDGNGDALTEPISGLVYFSDVATGLSTDALGTGAAALTNGSLDAVVAATTYHYVTTAAGLLGATLTNGAADSVWACFVMPNGQLLISDEMAITGP
jgi:hypothetical protein